MAKLSEVLGGIVKDVTQAQITSDLVSLEFLEHYQRDQLLKNMPVPRVRIRDVSLTLRFAVADTVTPAEVTDTGRAEVAGAWSRHVRAKLLPDLLARFMKGDSPSAGLANAVEAVARTRPDLEIDGGELLKSNPTRSAKLTENYVAEIVKALPAEVRAQMLPLREIRRVTAQKVKADLSALAPKLTNVAVAKTAADVDLNVLVSKEELAAVPESEIHEITLTIGLDETHLES